MIKITFASMKINRLFSIMWRVWFYTTVLITILLLFPFIIVTSQRDRHYPLFFKWARVWARLVLHLSGFVIKAQWLEKPLKNTTYIICANHTSMLDIMTTLVLFPNCFVFIGKKELTKLPLFGYFYKKTNLLVDRKSLASRRNVQERAAVKLDHKIGLCIFPEGGVPEESVTLAPFKNGAFALAAEKGVTIIPVTYLNHKKHFPFSWGKGQPGVLRAVIHPFLHPNENSRSEVERLKKLCFKTILQPLQQQDIKSKEPLLGHHLY